MKFMEKFRPSEVIVVASIVVASVLVFIPGILNGVAGGNLLAWLTYYASLLAGASTNVIYGTVFFFCIMVIALVTWSLAKAFLLLSFPRLRNTQGASGNPRTIFIAAARRAREIFLIVLALFFLVVVSLVMGNASAFNQARLDDQMLIGSEHWIFGNYVFAELGSIHYPHFFIEFVIWSFENMGLILILGGICIAYLAVYRFHELIVAFCIGFLIMTPLWLIVPALSPQDRYLDNVYGLPVPQQLALAVANYHPQLEVANFLRFARERKDGLPAAPTSTIPSAHIFWAVITGYYLFRTKKWLGWVALPILLASSFGTVLLVQHYFVDIPAGIAIAALAIWMAHGITANEPIPSRAPAN